MHSHNRMITSFELTLEMLLGFKIRLINNCTYYFFQFPRELISQIQIWKINHRSRYQNAKRRENVKPIRLALSSFSNTTFHFWLLSSLNK